MKAVPLALLLASSAMAGPLEGSWVVGAYPTGGNAATCCYLKPTTTLSLSGTTLGGTIDTTQASNAACAPWVGASGKPILTANAGASAVYADTINPTAATVSTVSSDLTAGAGAPAQANTAAATLATADSGVTLTWVPATVTTPSGTACAAQTLTRAALTISALSSSASYSAAAGTYPASGTCCLFDTTQNVVFTPTTGKVAVTGKLGGTQAQCSTTGNSITPTLKSTGTAGTYSDLTGATTYALSNEGKTITYTAGSGCTQTLTLVSSSALRVAGASAIVGATVLGLVVV